MMTRVIATHPPVELVDRRDDHTRVWEIVREVETTHPDGSTTVDTVKSYIHEKGSGLCYKDATGNYLPAVAEWRETPDGFVIDRCAYGLSIGKKIGAGMGYNVEGHELALRPAYLMVSDGVNEAHLALLNPDAEGSIVDGKPSVVRFPAAFGPGYDLEYVVEKGGFHQNLIIAAPPQLPAGFDVASATIYLYTEMNLDEYVAASGCNVSVEGESFDTSAADFISPPSRGGCISFTQPGAPGGEGQGVVHLFSISRVVDSPPPNVLPKHDISEKRLLKDPATGLAYVVNSLRLSYFVDGALPSYPVIWDPPVEKCGSIGTDTWGPPNTYWITADVTVSGTLTILPGAVVKLNPYTKISISQGGKVIAEGEPPCHVVFTKAADDDYGEHTTGPDGQYMTALQLVSGSQAGSVIQYCNMRYGVCGVDCLQSLNNPIAHNVLGANEAQRDMWFGINVQYDVDVACRNNLVRSCSYYGIYYYDASADDIRNNTVHDCGCGINLTYTTCPGVRDNLLTSCTTGIGANYGSLSVDYNGYWDCQTNISGKSMGANSVDLGDDEQDNPYAEEGEFLLDQSCALIGAGSRSARYAGLNDCSTSATADRDVRDLDIGYHYPHGYFEDTDQDGMPDAWEIAKLGGTGEGPDDDHDGDEVTNLAEYQEGTNPDSSDTDSDNLTDWQEYIRGGGGAEPNLEGGPYLLDRAYENTTGMRVRWYSSSAYRGSVRYRRHPEEGWSVSQDEGSTKFHSVILSGLTSGETYFYEPGRWENDAHTKLYGIRHFRAPSPGVEDFRFIVYGDNRGDPDTGKIPSGLGYQEYHARVACGILEAAQDAAFILHVADFVNGGQNEAEWCPQLLQPAACLYETIPIFTCIGNHEEANEPGAQNEWTGTYYDEFFHKKRWYSFDYGDCHFVCLDTNDEEWFDDEFDDDQRVWLSGDLTGWSGKPVFVWFHHPPFSSGQHGKDSGDPGRDVREHLVPIFQGHGAGMVFSGHDHLYERAACTYLSTNIRYIVAGGGGAPLVQGQTGYSYPGPPTPPDGFSAVQEKLYDSSQEAHARHFCIVDVSGSTFAMKMYKWSGAVKDEWP